MPSELRNSILNELRTGLLSLERASQRRSLLRPAGVNLCSNDYLGLAQSEELRAAIVEAVRHAEYVSGTGSRLLSGHFAIWDELENEFAEFTGMESALYFGSGYAANVGLLTALLGKNDLVLSDELNHASIIDGIRLSGARKEIYAHRDLNALEDALRGHVGERCRKIVVTESVFSMDGDIADVAGTVELAERYGASVIVDEAHGTAVHGPGGGGIVASAGLQKNVLAVLHTCGKALASAGAFVCGSPVLREYLINHARTFIFSTAMPPYMAEQVRAALRIARGMDEERQELLANAARLCAALHSRDAEAGGHRKDRREVSHIHKPTDSSQGIGKATASACSVRNDGFWGRRESESTDRGDPQPWGHSQIVPVIVGANEEALSAAEFLQGEGFAVRAIRPPTVAAGKARLRFSL